MRATVWLLAVLACGGPRPKPANDFPPVSDPAWALSYRSRAVDGCQCKDPACLDRVHAELAALETDHGGMDDAPPGVQSAHGDFDRCWRAGTKDPARDLEDLAAEACGCTTAACLDTYKLDAMHVADKYGVGDLDALATSPATQASVARGHKCVTDGTISADALLAIAQKATDTVCACDNIGCAHTAMKDRSDALATYFAVADLETVQDQLDDLHGKFCKCIGELILKAGTDVLAPFPVATKIDVTMTCK